MRGETFFAERWLIVEGQANCLIALETQLVADGLGPELRETLEQIGIQNAHAMSDEDLVTRLRAKKTAYAARFAARIRLCPRLADRLPSAFRAAIEQLRGLA